MSHQIPNFLYSENKLRLLIPSKAVGLERGYPGCSEPSMCRLYRRLLGNLLGSVNSVGKHSIQHLDTTYCASKLTVGHPSHAGVCVFSLPV